MFDQNREVFENFKAVHDSYIKDRKTWGPKFHEQGKEVMVIVKDWERRLCVSMERGKFAKFSNQLSDKFMTEIKKYLPYIELIGVKSSLEQ